MTDTNELKPNYKSFKPPFKKLDMNLLLDMACGAPEDLDEFRKYQESIVKLSKQMIDIPPYQGWQRFTITLHCSIVTVVARRHPDNKGYQIRDYLVQDH